MKTQYAPVTSPSITSCSNSYELGSAKHKKKVPEAKL